MKIFFRESFIGCSSPHFMIFRLFSSWDETRWRQMSKWQILAQKVCHVRLIFCCDLVYAVIIKWNIWQIIVENIQWLYRTRNHKSYEATLKRMHKRQQYFCKFHNLSWHFVVNKNFPTISFLLNQFLIVHSMHRYST